MACSTEHLTTHIWFPWRSFSLQPLASWEAIPGALQGHLPGKCHRPGALWAHEDAMHSPTPPLCSQQYSQWCKKLFAPKAPPSRVALELLGHLFSTARKTSASQCRSPWDVRLGEWLGWCECCFPQGQLSCHKRVVSLKPLAEE